MDLRPDPDQLLKSIQSEELNRGRLKIFMGYAAGVGKTYAMLEAAHQRLQEGIDVLVGYVETHGRLETDGLLQNLKVIPRKQVTYHGVMLPEMDVDAILALRPALALVDELAHTNAPGSRHPKRYLDVEELLDAGIDIYTTLNIQHLESMKDVVAQVTGVVVRETVPDRVIDEASEIEVIDLPPDELLQRLREGKVYIPDQAARAIQEFFRKGNLTALREMSLRRAAERVDDQMRAYMQTRAIPGPWPAAERLLVCASSNPLAERLIRTTRRLADELNAEWFAVHVELVSQPEFNLADRERVGHTLQLAEELGGKVVTLTGRSIHEAVLEYAHRNNVTKIVVGRPLRPRWQEWLAGSVIDRLIHASGDIDIYVISSPSKVQKPVLPESWRPHDPWWRYLLSLALVALATLVGLLVRGQLEPVNLVMLYLATVVITAIYLGRGPSLLATVIGVLAFDFFLVPPQLTLAVSDTQYVITFIGLFVVSLVVSTLTARVREQAEASIQREAQTAALYDLGRDLTAATDLNDVAQSIFTHISQVFGREVAIFLPEGQRVKTFSSTQGYTPDENELAVANWSFEHGQPAGRGTDTLPAAPLRCQPLKTARGIVGVLGLRPKLSGSLLTPEQRLTLDAFAHQAALALERANLVEQARQAELLQATEKLQTALLNSISHDLRTPLVVITGALSALDEDDGLLDDSTRHSLVKDARAEADRLNRLVGNLLNMTRIEAGALKLAREPCDISDLIGSAMEIVESRLEDRKVDVEISSEMPLVNLDFVLITQVLVNLLDNAIKYSTDDQPIEVGASRVGADVQVTVADRGTGIPPDDLEHVFDKFYRVQRPGNISGTGLGLSICKGIVEAHGGTIRAENRPDGGVQMFVVLPVD
jgi:two-component system, OmpR family, sensor histidine kinase KdpD